MASTETLRAASPPKSCGQILLARAFWVLVLFAVLFLVTFPDYPSEPPFPKPNLAPALVILILGAATWILMLVVCIRAFQTAAARPSVLSSIAFFLVFGCALLLAEFALQQL